MNITRDKTATPVIAEQRGIDAPEKVFIQPEGDYYEYSEDVPAHLSRQKLYDFLFDGPYALHNYIELFTCLPEVFAPIHEIASRVADATWQLKKDWNDEIDYKDQDFNRLFTQPNPFTNMRQHVYQSVCYQILSGKQLFYFNSSELLGDGPERIFTWSNLPPNVKAEMFKKIDPYTITELNEVVRYWYNYTDDGKIRQFEVEKVLPFVNFDVSQKNNYNVNKPISYLAGASKAIKNLIAVYEARGVIYIKRGALGFFVSKKSDATGVRALTKSEKAEARADFNSTYGVTGGRDTVGVTSIPVEWVKTAMSISELEPFEETLQDAVAIGAVLQVPPHLIPRKDRSTFSNADADLKAFYYNVVIPLAQSYALAFTKKFNFSRRYINADYSHQSILQDNKKDEATVNRMDGQTWLERFKSGVCSLNEWITAIDGTKGTGPLYESKIFELTPEQRDEIVNVLKLMPSQQNIQQDQQNIQQDGTNQIDPTATKGN